MLRYTKFIFTLHYYRKTTPSVFLQRLDDKSVVVSILLYGCERWTLTADLEKRIQDFEYKCYRRMLGISNRT